MLRHPATSLRSLTLGLVLLGSGCAVDEPTDVDAQQLSGVWVFTYGQTPDASMDALGGGQASVVDGCLQLGDAVVIWYDDHLGAVEDIIERVDEGETVDVQIGGGGLSLDEGSTIDDFPAGVLEHCSPTEIWFAAREDPIVVDGS